MSFINDYELEWNIQKDAITILHEDFITRDEDVEFKDIMGLQDSTLCTNISVIPLVVSARESPVLAFVVVVENTI